MDSEERIVVEIQDALLYGMRDNNLVFWVDCLDKRAVFVVRKRQLRGPLKTATYFSAEAVIVLGSKQFLHCDFFESRVFSFFHCEQLVTPVEDIFNEIDGCIKVDGF